MNTSLWEFLFGIRNAVRFERWDYLGNSIIEPYIADIDKKYFLTLNHEDYYLLPEINYYKDLASEQNNVVYFSNKGYSSAEMYREFYFSEKDNSNYVFKNEQGMIYLHNSWTPKKFLYMEEEEFLNSNVTLAKILKKLKSENRFH
jgi:hypothetical protein